MAHIPAQTEQRQAVAITPDSPSTSSLRQQSYSPAAYAAYYASQLAPSTSRATSENPGVTINGEAGSVKRKAEEPAEDEATRKKRVAREEDALLMREAAHRVAQAILADQLAVTYPDYQTPFKDASDVVQRLLPYHIFQQPDEELLPQNKRSRTGKERVTPTTSAQEEVDDIRSLTGLLKRRKALQERFRKVRTKDAERVSQTEQLYQIQYLVVDDDRRYNTLLNTEIRATRDQLAQLEKDAREKKEKEQAEARRAYQAYTAQLAAQAQANQTAQAPTTSQATKTTPAAPATPVHTAIPAQSVPTATTTSSNPYAAYAAAAASGTIPVSSADIQRQAQAGDYRAAYIQYAQAWAAYAQAQAQVQAQAQAHATATQRASSTASSPAAGTPIAFQASAASPPALASPLNPAYSPVAVQSPLVASVPSTPTTTKPTLPSTSTPKIKNPAPSSSTPATASTPSTSQPTSSMRSVPTHPIPLQIPSSVLPAFNALGIRPVSATEAASMTEKTPPAVLVGSRDGGQMLDITINLSLLDPTQLSGLAAVLNMVKTSGISLQAGTGATTTATAPATPTNATPRAAANGTVPNPAVAAYYASYYPYYQAQTRAPTAGTPPAQPSTPSNPSARTGTTAGASSTTHVVAQSEADSSSLVNAASSTDQTTGST